VFQTWPNMLTWGRIALIPLMVGIFYLPFWWARPAAATVFAIAAITDWLDGHLARRLDQTTAFGAFLDPVADKLIVTTALVLLVQSAPADFVDSRFTPDALEGLVALASIIIIGREIAITALREWMATIGEQTLVQVSWMGKVKTTFQIAAVIMLLFKVDLPLWPISTEFTVPIYSLGLIALIGAALMTLWSMVQYLEAAWPVLRDS
jgi:CDP-diacylglycerol---glycerol-3-phosphate 3-phosphatidyltransferase